MELVSVSRDSLSIIVLPKSVGEQAKSGFYEDIESLINDWIYRQQDHGGKSRDWKKMNEFLEEFERIRNQY